MMLKLLACVISGVIPGLEKLVWGRDYKFNCKPAESEMS